MSRVGGLLQTMFMCRMGGWAIRSYVLVQCTGWVGGLLVTVIMYRMGRWVIVSGVTGWGWVVY